VGYFMASNPVDGMTTASWQSNALTNTAFQSSVAASMQGIVASDVIITSLTEGTAVESNSVIASLLRRLSSTTSSAVIANYTVTVYYKSLGFNNMDSAYDSLSSELSCVYGVDW